MDQTTLQGKKFKLRRLKGHQRNRFGSLPSGLNVGDEVLVERVMPGNPNLGIFVDVEKKNGKSAFFTIPAAFLDIKRVVDPADVIEHPAGRKIQEKVFVTPVGRINTPSGFAWQVVLADNPNIKLTAKEVRIHQD